MSWFGSDATYADIATLPDAQVTDKAKGMSASNLDQAYADAHHAGNIRVRTLLSWVIIDRQAGVVGLADAALSYFDGSSAFPKYTAIQAELGRPSQVDLGQSSIADSAQKVGTTLKWAGGGLILGVVAIGLLILAVKLKK